MLTEATTQDRFAQVCRPSATLYGERGGWAEREGLRKGKNALDERWEEEGNGSLRVWNRKERGEEGVERWYKERVIYRGGSRDAARTKQAIDLQPGHSRPSCAPHK